MSRHRIGKGSRSTTNAGSRSITNGSSTTNNSTNNSTNTANNMSSESSPLMFNVSLTTGDEESQSVLSTSSTTPIIPTVQPPVQPQSIKSHIRGNRSAIRKISIEKQERLARIGRLVLLVVITGIILCNLFSMSSEAEQYQKVDKSSQQRLQEVGMMTNEKDDEDYNPEIDPMGDNNIDIESDGGDGGIAEQLSLLETGENVGASMQQVDKDGYRINSEEEEDDEDEDEEEKQDWGLPFDISTLAERMRMWRIKKQLDAGFFYTPPDDPKLLAKRRGRPMKEYSTTEIIATIPHFMKELLLIMYSATTDEFIVYLPGEVSRAPPQCIGGCTKIANIMQTIVYAYRNRFPQRFQKIDPYSANNNKEGQQNKDLLFLVSTGDTPRLTRDCYAKPGWCKRRMNFAPILHFGTGFKDSTILPSLVTMPPPGLGGLHLRCMAEWQTNHEICEFLQPQKTIHIQPPDGSTEISQQHETNGMIYGDHINYFPNYNATTSQKDQIGWNDLINQVIWRGYDIPYLPLFNEEMRIPNYEMDIEPKVKEYSRGVGGIIRALNDVYEILRPRWKAIVITAQAEFEANVKNDNPKRKQKVEPWADMKFINSSNNNVVIGGANNVDPQWNELGIPTVGDNMSMLDMAKYKYHIDLGGAGGSAVSETIQKLALPGVLFHFESPATDWYSEHLIPWVHYIPVKEDLSDLKERYDWAEKHVKKTREIAKRSTQFARALYRPEGLDELYRRHFLKPLEHVIDAFQPYDEIPEELLGKGDGSNLVLKEIMRCTGYNIEECILQQDQ